MFIIWGDRLMTKGVGVVSVRLTHFEDGPYPAPKSASPALGNNRNP